MPASFADSNILLYLISDDERKRLVVRGLIGDGLTISVQVLNEVANVARRKHRVPWDAIGNLLDDMIALISVEPLTLETHKLGRAIAARYGFAFYDSLIVASATNAQCTILFSEDMHHGQKIGDLTIINPFR